jgi:transcriptional regulator
LILKTLTRGPSHGYAIARFIEETSGDAVLVEDGSLYPALYRLERRGWVEAEWGMSELGRRAKLYRLTERGREQLATELATWRRFTTGISKVLLST